MTRSPERASKGHVCDVLRPAIDIEKLVAIPASAVVARRKSTNDKRLGRDNRGKLCCFVDTNPGVIGFEVVPYRPPSETGLTFARRLLRIYASDIKKSPEPTFPEIWASLSETRIRRAIATQSTFSTVPFTQWLRIAEDAAPLLYEGQPFSFTVFFAKNEEWIADQNPEAIIRLDTPMSLRQALHSEKWLRALSQAGRVGLLAVGREGQVTGLVVLPPPHGEPEHPYAPHHDLTGFQEMIKEGTAGLVVNRRGDIYVMLAEGTTFCKAQGRWTLHDYESFDSAVEQHIPAMSKDTRVQLIRAALDLSYERRGALFCITKPKHIKHLVLDANSPQSNQALRVAARGLCINAWLERQVIVSGASVDGATILDKDGTVLDIACMIATRSAGKSGTSSRGATGARSTAALAVSRHGAAIKVSEDGPISLYANKKLIARLG